MCLCLVGVFFFFLTVENHIIFRDDKTGRGTRRVCETGVGNYIYIVIEDGGKVRTGRHHLFVYSIWKVESMMC